MGVRSEVGMVLGPESLAFVTDNAEQDTLDWLELADVKQEPVDGGVATLYTWKYVKWYRGYEHVDAIYKLLKGCPQDNYKIIVATSECPGDDSGDYGEYDDDPFDLHKYTTESLSIF